MDSTALSVCKNPRIHSHRVFAGLAERGKTSTGWFLVFKLHLIFNDRGELLNLTLALGNVDESTVFFQYRPPVPKMVHKLFGKLFADRRLHFQKAGRRTAADVPCSIGHGHPFQYEKCADAFD